MCSAGEYGIIEPEAKYRSVKRDMAPKQMILIVAPPGNLQLGLQALLAVLHDVEVLVAAKGPLALEVIERHAPSLVILDDDLSGDAALLSANQIKARWPEIRCLVLVSDEQQRQRVGETSADLVLIKGYPAAKLIAAIEGLLS
jgi:two-component system chemotaxis response regulator CheY